MVRIHCKLRYQRCHPIHSSYPLRDEQVLTGRRVTIKYLNGEQPGRPTEDSWVDPPAKEDRQDNKVEGRWTGYTFFELREPARDAEVVCYYVGERPIGEWARRTETLPPHLRIPHDMRATEAAQARAHRMTRAASSGHGYEFAKAPTVMTPSSTPSVAKAQKEKNIGSERSGATSSAASSSTSGACCAKGVLWINIVGFGRSGSWRKGENSKGDRQSASSDATSRTMGRCT